MADSTTVPVKSAWASKINWLQIVTLAGTFATGVFGALNLDPATTLHATVGVASIGQILTIILRTFFTTSIVGPSAPVGGQ